MPDNSTKIAELEAILQAGVTTINISGTVTTVDLDVIRQQLLELRRQDTVQTSRKPRVASINLGGLM